MRDLAKANPKRPVRRIYLFVALLGLLIFVVSHRSATSEHPTIQISDVCYGGPVRTPVDLRIHVDFGLTNTGSAPFSVIPLQGYVLRIETTDNRCRVEDHISGTYFLRTTVWPFGQSLLRPNEGGTTWLELPMDTKRWQVGYQITLVSAQSNIRMKLGDMFGKAIITLFGNRIADEKQAAMVWGPVVEMQKPPLARSEELLHSAR